MGFLEFKKGIFKIARKAKLNGIFIQFDIDDKGKYKAVFPDGTTITGNKYSKKITVLWNGFQHMAMAEI